jgi:rubrerythrin
MARKKKSARSKKPKRESSGRVRLFGDATNRTGLLVSPLADEMLENTSFVPDTSVQDFESFRGELLAEGGPVGTMPRPASFGDAAKQAVDAVTAKHPLVLLDKLAERLAFERSGTRLYETLLAKHDQEGSFDGGPDANALLQIREEELEHFHQLIATVERLGGDPTAVTPSADLAAVASMGVVQVITDPRVSFAESLDAILIAELVDVDGWELLLELAQAAGDEALVSFAERAREEEERHLDLVRGWIKQRSLGEDRDAAIGRS